MKGKRGGQHWWWEELQLGRGGWSWHMRWRNSGWTWTREVRMGEHVWLAGVGQSFFLLKPVPLRPISFST